MQRPLGSKAQIISNIRGQEEEEVAVVVEVEEVAEEATIEVVSKEIIIRKAKDIGGITITMVNLEKMEERATVMEIEEEVDIKIMPISKNKKENFMRIKMATIEEAEVAEVAEEEEEEEVEEVLGVMVEMEVILNTIRKKKNYEAVPLKVPS